MFAIDRTGACAILAFAVGCRPGPADNPPSLTDTTTAEFAWRCVDDGCDLGALAETPPALPVGSSGVGYEEVWGRFFHICSAFGIDGEEGWGMAPGVCRATTCADDSDCPQVFQFRDVAEFECAEGMCQARDISAHARDRLDVIDAQSLCFATAPRSATADQSAPDVAAALAAIDDACDNDGACSIPSECEAFSL